MTLPSVAIILLNWNNWQETVACVESCRDLSFSDFRILIVDNGSTDGSETNLRKRFPGIEFIQTGANLGFAGGNNIGIRHALDQGADYVWLLNNDTVVDTEALTALVRVAEDDKAVGMVGSKIVYHDSPRRLWFAGAMLDPQHPYQTHHRGLNEEDRGQYDAAGETGYITGCSLLARREMMSVVGLLEDEFFLYFEDADWSARAKSAGWKLIYCPDSVVYHKVSLSVGGAASPALLYYTARNRLYFVKRNFPDKMMGALLFDFYEHVLVNIKKGRFICAREAIRGISDFVRGKTGPR